MQKLVLIGTILSFGACAEGTTTAEPPQTAARLNTMKDANTHIAIEQSIAKACSVQTPSTTYFEFDSAAMSTNDPNLERVADCLANGALKDRNIRVSGYTDPRGTDAYNKELGKSRAETVASYFEAKGVKSGKIITKTHGKELSVGQSESGYAFDRRVSVGLAD